MEVRPVEPTDLGAVRAVVDAAFGAHDGVGELWDEVRRRELVTAELVAMADGEVVGHVGLSHAWIDARRELVDVVVLGPLSVRPDRQREGVGTALVAAATTAAERAATPLLFLEGDPGYYGSRGFDDAGSLGFEAPSRRIPGPAFQVVVLPTFEGWMTGRLVYHDVWWEHGAVGLRDPRLAEIERRRPQNRPSRSELLDRVAARPPVRSGPSSATVVEADRDGWPGVS